jgi:hypothetical protein
MSITEKKKRSLDSGLPDFSWYKKPKNIPNSHKIYQMAARYTKIDNMAIKYTNIFHCKTLQNLPIFFWFENVPSGNPGLI